MNELQQRIRALRAVERHVTPDAAWVRATRNMLLAQAKSGIGEGKVKKENVPAVMGKFVGTAFNQFVRTPVMAIISILVFMIGGSLMSVSAAERAMPGDFLYGLKLATEQAQLALVSGKGEKLKLKTEFTERRVQELKVVSVQKSDAKVKQVAEMLKSDLSTMKDQLGDVKTDAAPDALVAAAKMVDQKTTEAITALQETKADLSPETKKTVTEAQSVAADTGVQAIEVLAEQHQAASGTIPVADVAEAIQNHTNAVANIVQAPLELTGSSTSSIVVTSTVDALIQSIATSTASTLSGGTSTVALPQLITQVKDMTAQVFAIQKANEQLEGGTTTTVPSDSTTSTTSTPVTNDISTTTKTGS